MSWSVQTEQLLLNEPMSELHVYQVHQVCRYGKKKIFRYGKKKIFRYGKKKIFMPIMCVSSACGVWRYGERERSSCLLSVSQVCKCKYVKGYIFVSIKLIERNPPSRGGFVFTVFPHQEPCGRGPPSKDLFQVLRGGSSYTRLLMREHSKYKTPPGGGGSFDQSVCEVCRYVQREIFMSIKCV